MDLSNNFITDVFPLGCCIELNELDLSNNNVRDIQPLIGK
jgi:Leucine-rich repeat (LRR) protein